MPETGFLELNKISKLNNKVKAADSDICSFVFVKYEVLNKFFIKSLNY